MKKVLITAPLRQDKKVFVEYSAGIDSLELFDVDVSRYYVVNDCPEIIPLINGRADTVYDVINTNDPYQKTHNDHIWTDKNLNKMPMLRNKTIEHFLAGDWDYWFSVDTDLVLHPLTLQKLLEADKDIVSEIFWTQAPNKSYWCNAWMYDNWDGMLASWKTPGLYQVGMTGACTLVKRKVLEAGVNYSHIPNLKFLWGEDRHFCVRAACHDFELWLDTHYPATHLYCEKEYNQYLIQKGRNT